MVNYGNSVVYKLCCKDASIDKIYVGVTTNFTRRKHLHKTQCTDPKHCKYNTYLCKFIRKHGGWNNWDMILVKAVKCRDKKHLDKKCRRYVEKLQPQLNKAIETQFREKKHEYRAKNRNKILQQRKEYREKNRDVLREKSRQYRADPDNKHIIKAQKDRYSERHKDRISERNKKYYEENKEQLRAKQNEKVECECGCK